MRIIPLLLASLLLCGCASTWTAGRRYAPRDRVWHLGYSETQLGPDTWRVTYDGYEIPQSQAADYALLRAADLTLAAGFTHFAVIGESGAVLPGPTAAVAISPTMAVGIPPSRPEATVTIRATREAAPNTYDAAFISRSFRTKYRVAAK